VWRKGDTSGDRQFIRAAYYDCDGDTLLFVVEQEARARVTPGLTRASSGRSTPTDAATSAATDTANA